TTSRDPASNETASPAGDRDRGVYTPGRFDRPWPHPPRCRLRPARSRRVVLVRRRTHRWIPATDHPATTLWPIQPAREERDVSPPFDLLRSRRRRRGPTSMAITTCGSYLRRQAAVWSR